MAGQMVVFRGRIRYVIGVTALAVLSLVMVFFFLPAFRGETPPPKTIGNDHVVSGSGFKSGSQDGTSVTLGGSAGSLVLDLAEARPQGDYTSDPVKADYAFNALGLHWLAQVPAGAAVNAEVRFSQDGKQWGDWQPVPVDDADVPDNIAETKSAGETIGQLVYADRARYFQYRLDLTSNPAGQSPVVSRLTASYIDAKGYHQKLLSASTFLSWAKWAFDPPQASAEPGVISRAQWGADESLMTWPPEYAFPKKIIIHHTVTMNYDPDPAATVRSIYYYHAVSLGWGDIGYNYLVDWHGNVYEGRAGGNGVIGGHALGWNTGTIGISNMGNYDVAGITPEMYYGLAWIMTIKANENQIDPWGAAPMNGVTVPNIIGHRDVNQTSCPGQYLYAQIPNLRNSVHNGYVPIPIGSHVLAKWNALNSAPGAPLNYEHAVPGGFAQDFQSGRLMNNTATGQTWWVLGGILGKFDSLGGLNGFLGWPASDEYGYGPVSIQDFAGGKIIWQPQTGAWSLNGAIMGRYFTEGGASRWGYPISDEHPVPGYPGYNESDFQFCRIFWDATNGTAETYGAIMQKFAQMGGAATFGPPSGDEHDLAGVPGGRESVFANGRIMWTPTVGPQAVRGAIGNKYTTLGGPAAYQGMPVGDEYAAGSGRAQNFQRAVITYSDSLGAHEAIGAIMGKYLSMGGPPGYLGLATSDETDAAGVPGGRENDFQNGRIYWSEASGTHVVYGGILGRFLEIGGTASLGMPVTDEYDMPGVYQGRESDFARGRIYWHPATGAHEVIGGILGTYLAWGGPAGYMGLPITGEYDAPGGSGARESDFERSMIFWSPNFGAHTVIGAIMAKYRDVGGSASGLGLPVSEEYNYGSGRRSDFQNGYIYWDPAHGAMVVMGSSGSTTVTSDAAFEVHDSTGALLTVLAAGQTASISYAGGSYFVNASNGYSHAGSSYVRMYGAGIMQVTSYHDVPSWNTSLDDNRFRGTIEVRYSPVSNAVWVIDELPIEYYLRGIGETGTGSPAEYYKVMSVAARDYALWYVNNGGKDYGHGQEIFNLKNSRNGNGDDQQYKGYGLESRFPDLTAAVDATTGQVVTYGGNLALAAYFSQSDGRTRSAQEAWGTASYPWLLSVPDPDCNGMQLLGHGVGLSAYGARQRAIRGDSYQTILTYYYSGTAVQSMDTNKLIRVAIMRVS